MKLTFKTNQPKGKWASFHSPQHLIKLNNCEIGTIHDKPPHRIRLMIYKDEKHTDDNPNCDWVWITLKRESTSLINAKEFLKRNIELIYKKYKLRIEEE